MRLLLPTSGVRPERSWRRHRGADLQRVVAAACQKKGGPQLFLPTVKWITYDREIPGHYALYRAAQADFNVRGWQGCWRYIAPTALFFSGRPDPPTSSYKATVIPAASSQAGDLRSAAIAC